MSLSAKALSGPGWQLRIGAMALMRLWARLGDDESWSKQNKLPVEAGGRQRR